MSDPGLDLALGGTTGSALSLSTGGDYPDILAGAPVTTPSYAYSGGAELFEEAQEYIEDVKIKKSKRTALDDEISRLEIEFTRLLEKPDIKEIEQLKDKIQELEQKLIAANQMSEEIKQLRIEVEKLKQNQGVKVIKTIENPFKLTVNPFAVMKEPVQTKTQFTIGDEIAALLIIAGALWCLYQITKKVGIY